MEGQGGWSEGGGGVYAEGAEECGCGGGGGRHDGGPREVGEGGGGVEKDGVGVSMHYADEAGLQVQVGGVMEKADVGLVGVSNFIHSSQQYICTTVRECTIYTIHTIYTSSNW